MSLSISETADRGATVRCSDDTAELASAACQMQRQAEAHYGNAENAEHLNALATLWEVAAGVSTAFFSAPDLRRSAAALAGQTRALARDGYSTHRAADLRESLHQAADRIADRGQPEEGVEA